ncbi:hypothetical protein, partial [Nocardioides soli]|uniref:hypothetical protein n=1 Tax=Nocardioides soli TaxID=1036020 RepID=UPI001C85BB57
MNRSAIDEGVQNTCLNRRRPSRRMVAQHVDQQRATEDGDPDRRLVGVQGDAEAAGVEADPVAALPHGADRARRTPAQRGGSALGSG